MDLTELLALLDDLAAVEDLAALDEQLVEAADALLDGEQTDDVLAQLQQIAEGVEAVRLEAQARETADAERQAQADELARRIRGEADSEPEPDPAPADDEPEPEVEVEVTTPDTEVEVTTPAEAVAAAARPAPRLGRVAARRPDALPLRAPGIVDLPSDVGDWGLVASANAPGAQAGHPIETRAELATAFLTAIELSRGYKQGPRVKVPVARAGNPNAEVLYGRDRFLGRDPFENERRIQATMQPEAITAAGGRCVPSPVRYDLPVIGSDARPVRGQMMTRFGADRGGVVTIPPPMIEEVEGAVAFWTEANDVNPTDPTKKPCLTITCPDEDETVVQAITRCLRTGTFRQRFFGEQVEAWMRLAAVNHARQAEIYLLERIGAGSTQVTVGGGAEDTDQLGTTRTILAGLDRATAALASRHRDLGITYTWGAPFWLLNQMRTDLAREQPGSSDERLAMADAQLLAFFRVRGITPTFFLDGEAGQIFGAQGDGPLNAWPDQVITYLYPTGSWLFLDGGSLELGLFRDADMVSTNDVLFFGETFEEAHFHGTESWRLAFDVCPNGATSAPVDFNPCAVGS